MQEGQGENVLIWERFVEILEVCLVILGIWKLIDFANWVALWR